MDLNLFARWPDWELDPVKSPAADGWLLGLIIIVLLTFGLISASLAGERDFKTERGRGDLPAASDEGRASDRDRGINQPRYGDGGGQRHGPYNGPPSGGWRHYHDEFATGVLGGIIGGFVGSIFAPDPPPPPVIIVQPPPQAPVSPEPWSPEWMDYCQATYKTFDARTGFYHGYDGQDHFCH